MRKLTRATATQANRKISKKKKFPLDKLHKMWYNVNVSERDKNSITSLAPTKRLKNLVGQLRMMAFKHQKGLIPWLIRMDLL